MPKLWVRYRDVCPFLLQDDMNGSSVAIGAIGKESRRTHEEMEPRRPASCRGPHD